MKCPRCQTDLYQTNYEGVEIDKCKSCSGVWLDEEEILDIVAIKEETFTKEQIRETLKSRKMGIPLNEQNETLKCPKCQGPMTSFNYGVDSGVILDRCQQNHGLWFDAHELEKVQIYREHWDEEIKKKGAEWTKLANSVEKTKDPYTEDIGPFKRLVNLFFS